ncbi:hypothetical protein Cfor_09374 [Coptotermes formosanus]|uniref:Uncharacterized protein n=1 Tax=Coptotermes formosanus TaxID=36987 RepID=A0A6L2Q5G1_COPFO|nr:hypothetical protein Cfor_09374 [Coptotermes formosanus]
MLILFLLFLVQFSVACACLAFNAEQQHQLAEQGWNNVSPEIRNKVQKTFDCCEFDVTQRHESITTTTSVPQVGCRAACCSGGSNCGPQCPTCMDKLQTTINYAFKLCGGIGLFFSFTEFLGVWLTVRYRNQKDPRANPSAFL